jgi:hypothetical protein
MNLPAGSGPESAAPCRNKQTGHSPANTPAGTAAPHWEHFSAAGMGESADGVFIYLLQK